MKEFDKWWDEQVVPPGSILEPKIIWKAALEWVLKDLYRNQHGMGMDNLAEQIKEELSG